LSFLRSIFGPSKAEIWSQVAAEIGGQYVEGGFWGRAQLRCQSGEWELVLDTYTVSSGNSSTTYTRMRAPFVNKDGLYFKIYRTGFFSAIGKWLSMQDIEIGVPVFDENYVIKGNDEEKVRRLLASPEVRALMDAQPRITVEIKDDEGFFGQSYPDGVDILHFVCVGVIKDPDVLKDLFDLFCAILERLVQIDSAYENDPGIVI